MHRRRLCVLAAALLVGASAHAQITGVEVPEMADYDSFLSGLFQQYGVPGAGVAVVKDGRLIYARGFGMADTAAAQPVQPTSRFRMASVSKPITSVVVMTLVEDGLLDLDEAAFALLPHLPAPAGQTEDPDLGRITIRDLLQHSGGWNRVSTNYDPMFDAYDIAIAMGVPPPADENTIIRYMRGQPLDFAPGSFYTYSNLGYAVLGAIVEAVTGQPYEEYARSVLWEAGISDMEPGRSLLQDRLPDEVRYYSDGQYVVPSIFPPHLPVEYPYGGWHMEAFDALGAWIGSPVDLMRFMTAVDGRTPRPDILQPSSIAAMTARPGIPYWSGRPAWYALGWIVYQNGDWAHDGLLDGSVALLYRREAHGLSWIVLCNTWPDYDADFQIALDGGLVNLAAIPRDWPTHDLFPLYSDEAPGPEDPMSFDLSAAPNPFGDRTTVRLSIGDVQHVVVQVFDALGRRVAVLHDGPLGAGAHAFAFDAGGLAGGLYFVQATGETGSTSTRVTLAR